MLKALLCVLLNGAATFHVRVDAHRTADIVAQLQQINAQFNVGTNVLIHNGTARGRNGGYDVDAFVLPQMPTVIASTELADQQLIYSVDKNLLAVVLVGGTPEALRLASLVNVLMTRMHDEKLLFVLTAPLADDSDLQALFEWSWRQGYTRVLALYSYAATPLVLHAASYRAFSRVHIVPVSTPAQYFVSAVSRDFQGRRLRTPLATDPPGVFAMPVTAGDTGRRRYAGMYYELLSTFAARHNATLVEQRLPPPYPDTVVWRDAMKAVRSGAVDICVHGYFLDYRRWHTSYPIFLASQYFQVPHAQPRPGDQYLLLPLEPSVWLLVAVYTLATTLCAHWAPRPGFAGGACDDTPCRRHHHWRWCLLHAAHNYAGTVLAALPMLCYTANARRPRDGCGGHAKRLYMLQLMGGFFLANSYATLLTSLLTTSVYEPQLRTTADVYASRYRIEYGASELRFFPPDKQLRDKLTLVDDATLARGYRDLNTAAIRLVGEWKHAFYANRQLHLRTPRVRVLDEVIWSIVGGFNMPLTSPYVALLNDFALRVSDAGLLRKLFEMAVSNGRTAGILEPLAEDDDAPATYDGRALDMKFFRWSWILLGGGHLISGVAFLGELLWHRSTKLLT